MAFRIPTNVLSFAGEANLGVYQMFADYYNHARAQMGEKVDYERTVELQDGSIREISFSEKEEKLNSALLREIMRVAGVQSLDTHPLSAWANHPMLKWASFAVISAMVDMVLPDAIIKNIGMYSDVRVIGWGDSAVFDVKPRDIFAVSKAGRAKRTAELNKQFVGQVAILPELREMTVYVSFMQILAGKESLAELVLKMVRSFETALSYDVYAAMATAMTALDNTATIGLRVAGFTQADFVRLSQQVSSWNGGTRPLAVGTQAALAQILPANANYRYEIDSDFVKVGYIRNFQGTDIMVLPQVADWTTPFGLKLHDDRIWILSPSSDKIVKVVLEGSTLSNVSDFFEHANLLQTSTLVKSWGTGVATSAVAGQINL